MTHDSTARSHFGVLTLTAEDNSASHEQRHVELANRIGREYRNRYCPLNAHAIIAAKAPDAVSVAIFAAHVLTSLRHLP